MHSVPTYIQIMHLLFIIRNSTSNKRQQRQTLTLKYGKLYRFFEGFRMAMDAIEGSIK